MRRISHVTINVYEELFSYYNIMLHKILHASLQSVRVGCAAVCSMQFLAKIGGGTLDKTSNALSTRVLTVCFSKIGVGGPINISQKHLVMMVS